MDVSLSRKRKYKGVGTTGPRPNQKAMVTIYKIGHRENELQVEEYKKLR